MLPRGFNVLLLTVGLAVLGAGLLYPLAYAMRSACLAEGGFSLGYFRAVFVNPAPRTWLANSLILATVVTACTMALALPLAYWSSRRDFPGKSLLTGLLLLPMVLPPFVGAIGMRRLLARYGLGNLLLLKLGLLSEPLDFLGGARFWGVVLLEVLHLYPVLYLNLLASFSAVDSSLEEMALSLGDSRARVFWRVTLPLSRPGLWAGASIVFIWSFTDLGTPLVFEYHELAAKQIYDMVMEARVNPTGYALVVVVLALSGLLYYLGKRAVLRGSYSMLAKGAPRVRTVRPSAREKALIYPAFLLVIVLATLPHLALLLNSVAERWFMTSWPESYTWRHFRAALTHETALAGISNSLFYSLCSMTLDLALGLGLAYYLARSRNRLAPLLDAVAMFPLAIPGLVLAFGYATAYSGLFADKGGWLAAWGAFVDPRRNPTLLLILSYSVRRFPYALRTFAAGLSGVPVQLEEAAFSLGDNLRGVLTRVTLPLLRGSIFAAALLTFSFAMLEVSDSLILAMREQYYPLTKSIYHLLGRLSDGEQVASALGLYGMAVLALALLAAASHLGKRVGEAFRI